jgi:hypothetical protein
VIVTGGQNDARAGLWVMATDLTAKEAENPKSLKDFFEQVQPGRWVRMESPIVPTATNTIEIKLPLLEIHCSPKECDGFRFLSHRTQDLTSNF